MSFMHMLVSLPFYFLLQICPKLFLRRDSLVLVVLYLGVREKNIFTKTCRSDEAGHPRITGVDTGVFLLKRAMQYLYVFFLKKVH